MALLAILDGVRITVYPNNHPPPHVHAEIAEYRASFIISGGEMIKGFIPQNKVKAVQKFIVDHEFLLFKAWNDARERKYIRRIL